MSPWWSLIQLLSNSEIVTYLDIMLCLLICKGFLSFCLYVLDTYHVTGSALGAGDLEIKDGAVN